MIVQRSIQETLTLIASLLILPVFGRTADPKEKGIRNDWKARKKGNEKAEEMRNG